MKGQEKLFIWRQEKENKIHMIHINENIYGHKKRLTWFKKFINPQENGLDFGCGTGAMITSQLIQDGYNIQGIDLDETSINLGKKIFQENQLNPELINCKFLESFPDFFFDYIITSEVFEHIPKNNLDPIVDLMFQKLKPNGLILCTVPNGYGWYEFEDFFWKKLKIGYFLRYILVPQGLNHIRRKLGVYVSKYPSTLDESPHVRRFTINNLQKYFSSRKFETINYTGSVLISGNFSDMIFSSFTFIQNINNKLGDLFPRIASGIYIAVKKND